MRIVSARILNRFTRRALTALLISALLVGVAGVVAAQTLTLTPLSTNTVTQVNYPTTTSTVAGDTETIQPYETLTTTTVSGTQTYTTTVTSGTATTTISTDEYIPYAMYYTATTNNPFYEQLSPITATATDGTTFSESYTGDTLTMSIDATSTTYYDLGFYYVFQNLNQLDTFLTGHSITITGTGFAVNLWINPQLWNWSPEGVGQDTFVNLGTYGAYGLGATTGTTTVSSTTSFYITGEGSSLSGCDGNTYTVMQLADGDCSGIGSSAPFALWIGIDSTSIGTTTATVTGITSTPYP